MVQRTRWRYSPIPHNYSSCRPMELGPGIAVGAWDGLWARAQSAEFLAATDMGDPVYSAFMRYEDSAPLHGVVAADWATYVAGDFNGGPFKYSIFPILYSFTASLVITLGLTVIVFFNVRTKPHRGVPKLLRVAAVLACGNLLTFVVRAMMQLGRDHAEGVVPMNHILDMLWTDTAFNTVDIVAVLILQLCQVQTVMRFFTRFQEKRLISLCGILLAVVSQVLWAIPPFSEAVSNHFMPLDDDKDMDVLPPFVYLVRIAQAGSYASFVLMHIFVKKKLCVQSVQMFLLTVLTVVVVVLQPAFFIADVTNVWIDNLSEIFSTTCYMGSTVIVWEWSNRLSILEARRQAQSILGRPVYEDEEQGYNFARYALKIQTALTSKSDDGDTTSATSSVAPRPTRFEGKGVHLSPVYVQEGEQQAVMAFNKRMGTRAFAHHVLDSIIYYTDKVVVKGLGNLSASLSSKSSSATSIRGRVKKRIGLEGTNDVFVYRTKDLVFDSDDDIPRT
ncbi:AaceriAEL202Cp [[Ashbya] aceris (nom. inval.)]|nr:AaceriAEL202Cp [[Ashbya] aceris (nom. inval.)]